MPFINFLHTFNPSPILISFGPVHIYWYGFFIVLGVLSALAAAIYLAKFYNLKADLIIDLALWLTVGGVIGARIYAVFLEGQYFFAHPLEIFKIWQGGLAIHGALIGGGAALWLFAKKYQRDFWQLAAIIATVLPLAQGIGRWGNYFNQELFGYPTGLPWGIPIDIAHRPWQYLNYDYFHPTFLYESLGNLIIFIVLITFFIYQAKIKSIDQKFQISLPSRREAGQANFKFQIFVYFLLYSLLRFFTEYIRIDATPVILGWRWPQLVSLLVILACLLYLPLYFRRNINNYKALEK